MNSKRCDNLSGVTRMWHDERGFSLLEVLVVIAIIFVVTAMAAIGISKAQKDMRRENTIREFKAYVEKARLDSMRRNPTATADQAKVTITANNQYQVAMDFNYDGTLAVDEVRTFSIPSDRGVQFSTGTVSLPMTMRFDWRGSATAVESDGDTVASTFTIVDTYDTGNSPTTLNLTTMGGTSVGTAATLTTPSRSTVATTSNVKSETNTNTAYSY